MFKLIRSSLFILAILSIAGCSRNNNPSAEEILGNPDYLAMSYGGYREKTRDIVPTVQQLKEDMKILKAMNIKLIRTYNTQQYEHASVLLKAINELKQEDPDFEMYVMLGTWIECENAWSNKANHKAGNIENNTSEIEKAIEMANMYPDIVKIIAVGNEAMVQWAVNYFVYPNVILKWVDHLKELRKSGGIPEDIWITSSDNYESWGGGAKNYQTDDLADLIKAVDFVSLHTYPFHDSHYNPLFWVVPEEEESISYLEKIDAAMLRAKDYAMSQYQAAADYIKSLGIEKPIHIGETGWASIAGTSYGASGSKAADEYKEKLYYQHMRDWTNEVGMSCFYFEAFDEKWKDSGNALGSENHFGLIKLNGQAKYPLWGLVDKGTFDGLTRDGNPITKTYYGDEQAMIADVLIPPLESEMGLLQTTTVNENRTPGKLVTESTYVVLNPNLVPDGTNDLTYPSDVLKPNAWEGTCGIEISKDGIIEVMTGTGAWWGCALEIQNGGENLSNFKDGFLNLEIKGETESSFKIGFQTGRFAEGNQVNNFVTFGPKESYSISSAWKTFSIPMSSLAKEADLTNVTAIIYFTGDTNFDGKPISVKNIYYSQD